MKRMIGEGRVMLWHLEVLRVFRGNSVKGGTMKLRIWWLAGLCLFMDGGA